MSINYKKVNEEIIKICKSLDYKIKMYSAHGKGPIVKSEDAKYVSLLPDGLMISLTLGNSSDYDEIFIWTGTKKDQVKFIDLCMRIKKLCQLNGIGVTIKNYNTNKVLPKHFADEAKATKEREDDDR